tara:strand:+ start:1082 stop:1258 length:177 start_codon:yes stop_codon:yes gene_type:complete
MPDKLDFNSTSFKNSQAAKIVKNKPNSYGSRKKKSKNPTGILGLSFLNPKKGRFGSYS